MFSKLSNHNVSFDIMLSPVHTHVEVIMRLSTLSNIVEDWAYQELTVYMHYGFSICLWLHASEMYMQTCI